MLARDAEPGVFRGSSRYNSMKPIEPPLAAATFGGAQCHFFKRNSNSAGTLGSLGHYTCALIVLERALTASIPAWRASINALNVVTAERLMMAVILIVEDDVFIREIAEMMIQEWGHQTLAASDVDEALILLRSARPIDALFTDIYLKDSVLGGCELALQAIALRPNLRVLYTTGNTITQKMKALLVEGTHFLSKPYTENQLQASVKTMLAPSS
jgi:CheY-like chemotaxis protein